MTAPLPASMRGVGTRRRYPAGSLLFGEGDPPGPALVVELGTVRIATAAGGQIDTSGPGELIGELSALDGLPRSASAIAVTDVEVRAIQPIQLTELMAGDADVERFIRALAVARSGGPLTLRGPAGQGVPVDGLARWILDQPNDGDWVGVSLTQLGADLGVSRELLSRAIDHLVGRGAVALDRGRLLIRSREALIALSDPRG